MRDVLLVCIVFGALPLCFLKPSFGILMFSWLSYMNPHRLSWGFAYDFPFAQATAAVVIIGLLFSNESKKFPWSATVVIWISLVIWMCITSFFALEPDAAEAATERMLKIQLMIFVGLWVMGTKDRIIPWVWVTVASLGFYGVKGGAFAVLTGGNYRVWGPEGSFIEGNNELGLALIMILPLFLFLQSQAKNKYARYGLLLAMGLTTVAILSTQSRGAFLGIIAMGAFLWLKSSHKIISGTAILILAPHYSSSCLIAGTSE